MRTVLLGLAHWQLNSCGDISIMSMITNNMNKKINIFFLISAQLEAQSSSWRLTCKFRTTIYPSDFCRCILSILLYKGGLLSTTHINFSMSSTIDIAVWLKTQGLCTLLQLASNYLVASARGQTETWASYRYQQHFCCLENGSGLNRQQLFVAATEKLPVRALAYKAVFSIRAPK